MLNISKNNPINDFDATDTKSFTMLKDYRASKIFTRWLVALFLIFFITSFLPWTQNIRSNGEITTLYPNQRPQTVNSVIAGRIEKWFVREGEYVKKGDTLLHLSEVKDNYFDPQLLNRTAKQINNKEQSVKSYKEKADAQNDQIEALSRSQELKIKQSINYIQQAELKIESDSLKLLAAQTDYSIAQKQFNRATELEKQGLKSLTYLENKRQKMQETKAKEIGAANQLLSSKNKLINAKLELETVRNFYRDKLAKTKAEKFTTLSKLYDSDADLTKMQNKLTNYNVRKAYNYIIAPQDGYITKAFRAGIGETVKEGEALLSIMPAEYSLAVAMYIHPMDLPLITEGQKIRFLFDGWPSIAFSGWPDLSYGTFGGEVIAIDNFISDNGQYRILVIPDEAEKPWPNALRVGSGAVGMALLNDVPVWYELWRKLNGFPPDFYSKKSMNISETDFK